jgi:exonuclease-1
MGIQGLLPAIKQHLVATHVKELRGSRVAVDGYAWLHKASYGCAIELCTGKKTTRWIQYCMNLVNMLLSYDIDVTIVFDGANLPAKKCTGNIMQFTMTVFDYSS